ncbi:type II secretion system F family protein [Myxococcota bacterium]|nr:type II secretion system F family protein [Myxococcota bacterium]MBU1432416.1 type II secretion system F family protein [Myxococcota bacterium]
MIDREIALTFSALGILLEGEIPPVVALAEVTRRRPTSPTRDALAAVAARVEGGAALLDALGEAFPAQRAHLGQDPAQLPARLRRLGAHHLRLYGLSRRMHAVALYPLSITLLALLFSALLAFTSFKRAALFELTGPVGVALGLPYDTWLGLGLIASSAALLGYTLRQIKRGVAPGWILALPGGEVWARRAAAARLSLHALEIEVGAAAPSALDSPRFVDRVACEMAAAAPQPAEAFEQLAARLTAEAEQAGARLISTSTYLFLILAAVTVLAAFRVLFVELLGMGAWLHG